MAYMMMYVCVKIPICTRRNRFDYIGECTKNRALLHIVASPRDTRRHTNVYTQDLSHVLCYDERNFMSHNRVLYATNCFLQCSRSIINVYKCWHFMVTF